MPSKTITMSSRRAAEQAELEQFRTARKLVKEAQGMDNILVLLNPIFHRYNKNGLLASLRASPSTALTPEELAGCLDLTRSNMMELYNKTKFGGHGWVEKIKKNELNDEEARYLVAESDSGEMLGFMHFRFEFEDYEAVTYIYELQLTKEATAKGLGRFMTQVVELASALLGMTKLMCTCLKENASALSFYKNRCRFVVDPTSPDMCLDEAERVEEYLATEDPNADPNDDLCEYEILSKRLKTTQRAAP